jgi:ankyrin repeat protein
LSLDEINRIEQNSSTALQASCNYGHSDIVRTLFEGGASRRQLNKNNEVPKDQACNKQVKNTCLTST